MAITKVDAMHYESMMLHKVFQTPLHRSRFHPKVKSDIFHKVCYGMRCRGPPEIHAPFPPIIYGNPTSKLETKGYLNASFTTSNTLNRRLEILPSNYFTIVHQQHTFCIPCLLWYETCNLLVAVSMSSFKLPLKVNKTWNKIIKCFAALAT